jgi:hypothetical protein
MTYDTGNPKAVKNRSKSSKLDDKNRAIVVQALMGSSAGRKWIYELLEAGHIFSTSFTGDSASTFFREGERNHTLFLFAQIEEHASDQFMIMLKEAKDERHNTTTDDARATAGSTGSISDFSGPTAYVDGRVKDDTGDIDG